MKTYNQSQLHTYASINGALTPLEIAQRKVIMSLILNTELLIHNSQHISVSLICSIPRRVIVTGVPSPTLIWKEIQVWYKLWASEVSNREFYPCTSYILNSLSSLHLKYTTSQATIPHEAEAQRFNNVHKTYQASPTLASMKLHMKLLCKAYAWIRVLGYRSCRSAWGFWVQNPSRSPLSLFRRRLSP